MDDRTIAEVIVEEILTLDELFEAGSDIDEPLARLADLARKLKNDLKKARDNQ